MSQSHARNHPRKLHFMREWRLRRGMSQRELAMLVSSVKSLISRYENGSVGISQDLSLKVMKALRITPSEFFLPPPKQPDSTTRLRERVRFWRDWDDA